MAKHDGEKRIWIDAYVHTMLLDLSAVRGDPMRLLASTAIKQYCRRRAKPKAKARKD